MKTLTVKLDTHKVVALLTEAIADFPMALIAHINGQANCAKRGLHVPADQILEVFRPDFAVRVWEAEKAAGIDIPLRIHCYDGGNGHAIVAYRTAREVFAPYNNPTLDTIAGELDAIFAEILGSLKPYVVKEAA